MRFGEEQSKNIVLDLKDLSLVEVGKKYKFDAMYPTNAKVRNAVFAIYNKVKNEPEKYGLDQAKVDEVAKAIEERKLSNPISAEEQAVGNIAEVAKELRDKAAIVTRMKLNSLLKSRKAIKDVSLTALTTAFGTLVDKAQLLSGEATEHIAHYAKIESNMSPEDALKAIQELRESNIHSTRAKQARD